MELGVLHRHRFGTGAVSLAGATLGRAALGWAPRGAGNVYRGFVLINSKNYPGTPQNLKYSSSLGSSDPVLCQFHF